MGVVSSESDDEKQDTEKVDISCSCCGTEPDVFCLECAVYFCIDDFSTKHAELEGMTDFDAQQKEEERQERERVRQQEEERKLGQEKEEARIAKWVEETSADVQARLRQLSEQADVSKEERRMSREEGRKEKEKRKEKRKEKDK